MTERIVVRKKQAGRERKDGDDNALCACAKSPCSGEAVAGVKKKKKTAGLFQPGWAGRAARIFPDTRGDWKFSGGTPDDRGNDAVFLFRHV